MNEHTQPLTNRVNVPAPQISSLSKEERQVIETLRAMKFGTVEVTVHETRIVQVQKTEKMRF